MQQWTIWAYFVCAEYIGDILNVVESLSSKFLLLYAACAPSSFVHTFTSINHFYFYSLWMVNEFIEDAARQTDVTALTTAHFCIWNALRTFDHWDPRCDCATVQPFPIYLKALFSVIEIEFQKLWLNILKCSMVFVYKSI